MEIASISNADSCYCLSCIIGGQPFAVRLGSVRQILLRPQLVKLECPPDDVFGLVTWRSNVIPVLKTFRKLIVPAPEDGEVKLVLIVDQGSEMAGLVVDEIAGLFREGGTPVMPPRLKDGLAVNLGGLCGLVTPQGEVQSMWEVDIPAACNFTTPVATRFESMHAVGVAGFEARPEKDLFITFRANSIEYGLRLASLRRLMQGARIRQLKDPEGVISMPDGTDAIAVLDLPALLAAKPSEAAVGTSESFVSAGLAEVPEDESEAGVDLQKYRAVSVFHRLAQWAAKDAGNGSDSSLWLRGRDGGCRECCFETRLEKEQTLLVLKKEELKAIGIAAECVTGLIRGVRDAIPLGEEGGVLVKSSHSGNPIRMLDERTLINSDLMRQWS